MKFTEEELKKYKKERMEQIDRWLDNEYGCSYTRLEELHDFVIEQDMKHQEEKDKEIKRLNSIIKEVREYAEEIIDFVGDVSWVEIPSEDYIKKWQDILKILDKDSD